MSFNINNVSYYDFKDICRMCMFNCDVKFYQNNVISTIFLKLTDLHFETNDDLPKQICRNCFEKINQIHEFVLKCKQTHNALMECLNNQKYVKQNEIPMILDENVTINQFKTEYIEDKSLNLTDKVKYESNDIIPEASNIKEEVIENIDVPVSDIKEEVIENIDIPEREITIEEHKIEFVKAEHFIDETSEISNEQNIFESYDDLLIPNTSNIIPGNDEDPDYNYTSSDGSVSSNENFDGKFNMEPSKSFIQSSYLDGQVLTHSGERPFKCNQCSKSFSRKNDLHRHLRTHSGEHPFKCDQCSKSFTQSSHLDRHMLTHSGERPFKCELCLKSFSRKSDLPRHLRTHSEERPFKCDECSKSFTQSRHLSAHMRTHTSSRLFKCEQCTKLFTQPSHLDAHLRTHTGERPFKCDLCSKSFNHLGNMKRHMRRHSGECPSKANQT